MHELYSHLCVSYRNWIRVMLISVFIFNCLASNVLCSSVWGWAGDVHKDHLLYKHRQEGSFSCPLFFLNVSVINNQSSNSLFCLFNWYRLLKLMSRSSLNQFVGRFVLSNVTYLINTACLVKFNEFLLNILLYGRFNAWGYWEIISIQLVLLLLSSQWYLLSC